MELTRLELQRIALEKTIRNGKTDKHLPEMITRLSNAMSDDMTLQCKIDFNIGQLIDSFVNTLRNGTNSRWAKCYEPDFTDGNGSWEIKVSMNCYNLCTPLVKPIRTVFVTHTGAYTISKKTLQEIFDNPYDYQDYVKIEPKGLRLKPTIAELGRPYKWLNDKLGF